MSAFDWAEVSDEQLEAHMKGRVTPEMVEWIKRQRFFHPLLPALTDSAFGYSVGFTAGQKELLDAFELKLTEAQDPENN